MFVHRRDSAAGWGTGTMAKTTKTTTTTNSFTKSTAFL